MRKLATLMLGLLLAGSLSAQKLIQVKGSDTIVNMAQRLAEVYMQNHPETAIAVTGGGSGVGIAALIGNQIDIADASRSMSEKEYAAAKENAVVPVEIAIGIDGLSLIVNGANPVKSLTNAQAGAIFRGEITNWSEVGGPNMPISLYGRQPSSGTYVFIQEQLMAKKDYSPKMKQMNGNADILEGVKNDKAAIGYVGVGYVFDDKGKVFEGIKVLDMAKDAKSPAISPLDKNNVMTGVYPISRALYQYTNGKPKGSVRDFITFELGPEGQKVVEEMGFYPLAGKPLENNKKAGF
jgi:phosphate transport system substrate-binding protein